MPGSGLTQSCFSVGFAFTTKPPFLERSDGRISLPTGLLKELKSANNFKEQNKNLAVTSCCTKVPESL
jgi:hypothetical protein